jgi:hypothetical protein
MNTRRSWLYVALGHQSSQGTSLPQTQRSGRIGLVVNAITTAQRLIEAWSEKAAKHVIDNVTT